MHTIIRLKFVRIVAATDADDVVDAAVFVCLFFYFIHLFMCVLLFWNVELVNGLTIQNIKFNLRIYRKYNEMKMKTRKNLLK